MLESLVSAAARAFGGSSPAPASGGASTAPVSVESTPLGDATNSPSSGSEATGAPSASAAADGPTSGPGSNPSGHRTSGSSAQPGPLPTPEASSADKIHKYLEGKERLETLHAAQDLLEGIAGDSEALEAVADGIEPIGAILMVVGMVWNTIKAMETEERGCGMRGWCYGIMYAAMDMGVPGANCSGSLQGDDQDQLDNQAFNEGASEGAGQGEDVTIRNRLLLRIAKDGDPATTLTALWQNACEKADESQLADAYSALPWPGPLCA